MTNPRAGRRGGTRLLFLASVLVLAVTGPATAVHPRFPASSGTGLAEQPVQGTAAAAGQAGRSAATGRTRPDPAHASGDALKPLRIHDVQGRGQVSPLAGTTVSGVSGIVTVVTANGLWMQEPVADGDEATSEGLFVFTRLRPRASVGDLVEADGAVSEFRPGGSASTDLTRTEIDATSLRVSARGLPLPDPVVVGGAHGRRPPTEVIEDDLRGDAAPAGSSGQAGQAGQAGGEGAGGPGAIDGSGPSARTPGSPGSPGAARTDRTPGTFDPQEDGLDFYESLEGMLVAVDDAVAVGPRSPYGEVAVLPAAGAGASVRTGRGGILLRPGDANPERLILDDTFTAIPPVDVGDRFAGRNVGVLDFGFGAFKLLLTTSPKVAYGGLARESTRSPRPDELAIASTDLANLDPSDPPATFSARAREIVDRLGAPDVVVAQGLQDNSGPSDDGTVAADQTVAQLIMAISTAGGPAYDWRSVDPQDGADGGEAGGNPRVGFLFRTDRGLTFTDRQGGETAGEDGTSGPAAATTPTEVVDDGAGRPRLTLSPGRVSPTNPAWADTRKPVAGEFGWRGRRLFIVANHWTAPGGDDPLYGRHQPPRRPSEAQRTAQARTVAGFVNAIRDLDRDAYVVVAGNLNDTGSSPALRALTRDARLADPAASLPRTERYTAVVDGNSAALDHLLLSRAPAADPYDFDVVHADAEFADQAGRHDPVIVRLAPAGRPEADVVAPRSGR